MNHAQLRALERHGIFLGPKELRQIAKNVILRRGIMLNREESGIETWVVKVRDQAIKLVFAPNTCKIITILPHGSQGRRKKARRR